MARDWKIGEVVWLKSGGPAMTVVAETTKHDGLTQTTWYENQNGTAPAEFSFRGFPKDCLTDEEPSHSYSAHMRKMALIPQTLEIARPESIKVEPVTINWHGQAPSAEMIDQIVSQVRKTLTQEMADAVSLVSSALPTSDQIKQESKPTIEKLIEAATKGDQPKDSSKQELRDPTEDSENKKLRSEIWKKAGGQPSKQDPPKTEHWRNTKPLT